MNLIFILIWDPKVHFVTGRCYWRLWPSAPGLSEVSPLAAGSQTPCCNCCSAAPTRAGRLVPLLEYVQLLQGKCHLSFPTGASMWQSLFREMQNSIWEQTNKTVMSIFQAGKSGFLPKAHLQDCGHNQGFAIQFFAPEFTADTVLVFLSAIPNIQRLQRAPWSL